jgi:hypothetical protein
MLAITDIIVIVLLIILAANGAYQGLLRSLVGPVSLILSLLTGILLYLSTKLFSAAFLCVVLGPFFYGWILVTLLKKWLNPDDAPRLSMLSRVGGQVVNLAWGGLISLVTVAFLAFFPFNRFDLGGVSKDVRRSLTFRMIEPLFISGALSNNKPINPYGCITDLCSVNEESAEKLLADPNVLAIMSDPRIQKLQNDPETQKALETRDYRAILASPVVRELSQDPKFLIQVLKVYPKIQAITNAQSDQSTSK